MCIRDSNGAAQQAYAAYRSAVDPGRVAGQGNERANTTSARVQPPDHADISPEARRHAQALDAVRATPETRTQLVTSLQNQVQSGTYKIDDHALAQAIVQHTDLRA